MPEVRGLKTIMTNHAPDMVARPESTWEITTGNLIWEEIAEVARRVGASFQVTVTFKCDKQIIGAFAGHLDRAHSVGCAVTRQSGSVPVLRLFLLVLTTNSEHPPHQNLCQSVKRMSATGETGQPRGPIVIASECRDAIPDHGQRRPLLRSAGSSVRVLKELSKPGVQGQDAWQLPISQKGGNTRPQRQAERGSDLLRVVPVGTSSRRDPGSLDRQVRHERQGLRTARGFHAILCLSSA